MAVPVQAIAVATASTALPLCPRVRLPAAAWPPHGRHGPVAGLLLPGVLELARAARVAELTQRLRLDLADPLAGDVELLANLLERPGAAVLQPEAELQDSPLTAGQRV